MYFGYEFAQVLFKDFFISFLLPKNISLYIEIEVDRFFLNFNTSKHLNELPFTFNVSNNKSNVILNFVSLDVMCLFFPRYR